MSEPQVHKPAASVGSGFIVMTRDGRGRLKGGSHPYEHPCLEAAEIEAARLLERDGRSFEVYARVTTLRPSSPSPVSSSPTLNGAAQSAPKKCRTLTLPRAV